MVLRDRDAAADGTYEERRYVLQNWRADVSCIIEDDGDVVEWVRYTPYGVAYSIPWVNADRNGDDGIDDLGDGDFANDIRHEHIKERRCLRADAGGTGSSGSVPRTDTTPASRTDDAYTAGASVQKRHDAYNRSLHVAMDRTKVTEYLRHVHGCIVSIALSLIAVFLLSAISATLAPISRVTASVRKECGIYSQYVPNDWIDSPVHQVISSGIGVRVRTMSTLSGPGLIGDDYRVTVIESGFPFACFRAISVVDTRQPSLLEMLNIHSGAKYAPETVKIHYLSAGIGKSYEADAQATTNLLRTWVPILPIWQGLCVNMFLTAAALYAVKRIWKRLHGWRRRRAQLCVNCGYPYRPGRCPECGVPSSRVRRAGPAQNS